MVSKQAMAETTKLEPLIICADIAQLLLQSLAKEKSTSDPCPTHSHPIRRKEGNDGVVFYKEWHKSSPSPLNQYFSKTEISFCKIDGYFVLLKTVTDGSLFRPLCILNLHLLSLNKLESHLKQTFLSFDGPSLLCTLYFKNTAGSFRLVLAQNLLCSSSI